MDFEIIGRVAEIEVIAVDRRIRDLARLRRQYGKGRWRKLKGIATVRLINGTIHTAEIHWYEAHGIGQFEHKIIPPLID
ncbi:MAG: hypothetical protein AUG51_13750 [Acidobacteria bacterium 13_1_20CM_3_53_8]|nr:MAG: hypothetical protein AUG51_13750 [Acidobacteria bacterium 13_1_20CM_3_53_8]